MWYIDIFFMCNVAMDFFLLFFLWKMRRRGKIKIFPMILSALFGGLFSVVAVLFWFHQGRIASCLTSFFGAAVMILITFGKKGFLKNVMGLYFCSIILAGIIFFLNTVTDMSSWWKQIFYGTQRSNTYQIIGGGIVLCVTFYFLKKRKTLKKNIFHVSLIYGDKRVECKALYDTGNCLKTIGGTPVNVVDKNIGTLFLCETEKIQLIPYKGVGEKTGLMEVVIIEMMIIHGEEDLVVVGAALGLSERKSFNDNQFQVILNADIFKGE